MNGMGLYAKQRDYGEDETKKQRENTYRRLLSSDEDEEENQESVIWNSPLVGPQFRKQSKKERIPDGLSLRQKCQGIVIVIVGLALIAAIYYTLGMKILRKYNAENNGITTACSENQNITSCPHSFPWDSYRLPKRIMPTHYGIFLHPNLTRGEYVGEVVISIMVHISTNAIVFHSRGLNITNLEVFPKISSQNRGILMAQNGGYNTCKELDLLAVQLRENLLPGQEYGIRVAFKGELKEALRGFYLSSYKTKSGEKRTLATTQFEPADARSAFPCFDEPAFKANFSISIVRDEKLIALSNMPVEKTENFIDDLKLDKFKMSPPMSTYLVAFVVAELKNISKVISLDVGPVKVSAYTSEDNIDNIAFALNLSCKALKFYEGIFKVPYALPKLDLVAIPDFEASAMENWGLMMFRETEILWYPEARSVFEQERVAITVIHELAHQWFGNLVTMQWWDDVWLNEGFASYMEYYAVGLISPAWLMKNGRIGDHTLMAVHEDESIYTHPVIAPASDATDIEGVFDDVSYSKGASIIRMMADFLGEDLLISGISDYLHKFEFKNVASEDLIRSVVARAKDEQQKKIVFNMLESLTKNPGFPIINASLVGNEVTLSQKRYMPPPYDDSQDPSLCQKSKSSTTWDIPITFRTNLSPRKEWIFLSEKTITFRVGNFEKTPDWVLFNVNRGGYYVVNYNSDLLRRLSAQLKKDHSVFTTVDRSGIIFNADKSAQAGYLPYNTLLDMLLYLRKENEYWPIQAAYDIIHHITNTLKLQFKENLLNTMNVFTRKLFQHLYIRYGWPTSTGFDLGLSHPEMKLRKIVIRMMCGAYDANCTTSALSLFNYQKTSGIKVHVDYMDVVYSTAVRLGPSKNWDYLWNIYKNDSTMKPIEKEKILIALCQTTEEKKIVFLLEEALKGKSIRIQDSSDVFKHLRSTRSGTLLSWNFMKSEWGKIRKIYTPGSFSMRSILTIFNSFVDESEIAGAEKFVVDKDVADLKYVKRALDLAKKNVYWIKNYQPDIAAWLNNATIEHGKQN